MTEPILEVEDLVVEFSTERGTVRAVDEVSFSVRRGETVGLVGESGCGKSVTALALMGLVPSPQGRIAGGSIRLQGRELVGLPERRLRGLRGSRLSMIFQEPMTALNPVFDIGNQMVDVLRRHEKLSRRAARARAADMLRRVGIPDPGRLLSDYPHQLSGGMRQRVMIAMALTCNPDVLIADEPTTALDVTTQAMVLEQITALQAEFDTAVLLITHDLGVVAETCHRGLVMYCGKLVEAAGVEALFRHPRHPYTRGLLDSMPRLRDERLDRLPTIPGTVPDPGDLPAGCRFVDRCPRAADDCRRQHPPLTGDEHRYACYHPIPADA